MTAEFSHRFKKSLFETVRFGRIAQDYREALHDDDQKPLIGNKRAREFIYNCNRATLSWLCDFCRIDLLADGRREVGWRRKWWPYLVLAALITNVGLLFDMLRRQYLYDFGLFKYERLAAEWAKLGTANVLGSALEEELRVAGQELRLANASVHSSTPFVGQCMILYYLPQALIVHILISLQLQRGESVLFAPRAILDESSEASAWTRLIVDELEHLTRDNLSFVAAKCDQIGDIFSLSGHWTRRAEGRRGPESASSSELGMLLQSSRRLAAGHEQLKTRLTRIALEGRLNRFQHSPRSRDLLQLDFFASFWLSMHNFAGSLVLSHRNLKQVFLGAGKPWGSQLFGSTTDLLSAVCLFATTSLATSFCCALLVTAVSDQLLYVRNMKLIMSHLIATNTRRVLRMIAIAERLEGQGHLLESRLKSLNEALETDVLVVILQWRLASRSFELLRRPVTLMVLFTAYIAASMPVLFRLHSPYLPADAQQINLALGLLALAITAANVVPLAILHQRWIHVFGTLWSLVAHIGRLESVPAICESLTTCSSVAFLTLRREVSDPIQRNGRFALRIASIPTTYANLIRTIAWLLLVLSSIYDNQNNLLGSWLGHYMDDPFGLIDRDEP